METRPKKRPLSACGDDDSLCQSRTSSTFQRFTPSRLSSRPLRWRRSKSVGAASTYSAANTETDTPLSCVTRQTLRDGCAFNRFMVWVAVKRNAIPGLTPEEKLECPLLQCRKRFPNHELMLQHVYTCEYLDTKAYYCYDCQREEMFDDAKCKRCLGHPQRFRKLFSLSRYKSIFSSMGRKTKKEDVHLQPHPTTDSFDQWTSSPSYECLPPQAELSSTSEIMELDSRPLATLPVPDMHIKAGEPSGSRGSPSTPESSLKIAAELESAPQMAFPNVSGGWFDQYGLFYPPVSSSPTRPTLHLNTTLQRHTSQASQASHTCEMSQISQPVEGNPGSRSIFLAPRSSVRSTTSGHSVESNSTVSTGMVSTAAWSDFTAADSSLATPISPTLPPFNFPASSNKDFQFHQELTESVSTGPQELLGSMSPFPDSGSTPGTLDYTVFDASSAAFDSTSAQIASYNNVLGNWKQTSDEIDAFIFNDQDMMQNADPLFLPPPIQDLATPGQATSRRSSHAPEHRPSKRRKMGPGEEQVRSYGPECTYQDCDYRPYGVPEWWKSSMDKHIRNKHCAETVEFKCPYPGCKSVYTNRRDNLKAHMRAKDHWYPPEMKPPEKRRKNKAQKEAPT